MPKLYECGLPGFNPGNPESKAIETMRIRPANDHAIITGRNGVGKTSAYIEPALDLLSRDTRGRKGRGSIAQRMRECHASHPYIYYEELIITNNAADKESTAVFCGKYIDNKPSSAEEPQGFYFLYQHSAAALKDIDDMRPVYEKLEIHLVTHDPADSNKKAIADGDLIKAEIRRKNGLVFDAKGQSKNGSFTSVLSSITGHDFITDRIIRNTVSRDESLKGLDDMTGEQLLDRIVYKALEYEFLDSKEKEKCSSMLVTYCKNKGDLDKTENEIATLAAASRALTDAILPAARRADDAARELAAKQRDASTLLGRIDASEKCADQEITDLKIKQDEIAASLSNAEKEEASLKCWSLHEQQLRADKAEKQAREDLRVARETKTEADRSYLCAKACQAALEHEDADAACQATESALRAQEQGLVDPRLADVSFTLQALHEQRTEAAKKAEADALAAVSAREAETDSLHAERTAARDAKRDTKSILAKAEQDTVELVSRISEFLKGTDQDTGSPSNRPASWREVEAAAAEARAEKTAEAAASDEEKTAAYAADARADSLRTGTLQDAMSAVVAAEHEKDNAEKALAKLEQWIDERAEDGADRRAMQGKEDCAAAADSLDGQIEKEDLYRREREAERKGLEDQLNAERNGLLQVPAKAFEIIKAAGIEVEAADAADNFLRGLAAEQQVSIRKRVPWITAAVVVRDDSAVEAAAEAIAKAEDQWFPGGIGIVSQGVLLKLVQGEPVKGSLGSGMRFTARPDEERLASPDAWRNRIAKRIEDLELTISESKAKISAKRGLSDALRTTITRFYADEATCLADYEHAADEAAARLALAQESKASAEREIEQAYSEKTEHLEASAAHERAATKALELERCLNGAIALKDRLLRLDDEIAKAKAEVETKSKDLDAVDAELEKVKEACKSAHMRAKDASAQVAYFDNELLNFNLASKADGKLINDASWTQLKSEYHKLNQILIEKTKDLDHLRKELQKQQTEADDLDQVRIAAAERLTACGGDAKAIEPRRVPSRELFELEGACTKAQESLTACTLKHEDAEETKDRATEEHRRCREAFEQTWKTAIIAKEEIDGNPTAKIGKLKIERTRIETTLREKKDGKGKLMEAGHALVLAGVEPSPAPVTMINPEEALALADSATSALRAAIRENDSSHARLKGMIESHNAEMAASGSAKAKEVACVPEATEAEAARAIKHRITGIAAAQTHLSQKNQLSDNAKSEALEILCNAASMSLVKLKEIESERRSKKRVKFDGIQRDLPADAREAYLEKLVNAECAKAMVEARTAAGLDEGRLEASIKDRILRIKTILQAWCSLNGEDKGQRIGLKVRNPRRGSTGYVSWDDLPSASGGERASARLIAIISLQAACALENGGSSVLYLDTPFSGLTSKELIDPIFEVCEKTNTQLIVVQDAVSDQIADRFPFRGRLERGTFQGASSPVFSIDADCSDSFAAYLHEHNVSAQPMLEL